MEARDYKKTEQKLHREFHSNVHLLTLIYPPRKEFENVFKENMFIKSNKAGFHEVVYYLLGIIEPDKLKQRIPSWPIVDLCLERSFRSEVLKYCNDLNAMYEDACLPKIAPSHLICPGGVKFTKFMLQLSYFVLYVHVKRSGKFWNVLYFVRPTKLKNRNKELLEKFYTSIGNISSARILLQIFADWQETAVKESYAILEKQKEARKICKIYDAELEVLKNQALCDDVNQSDMFVRISKIFETLTNLRDRMCKCQELSNYLNGTESEIGYVKGTSNNCEDEHENLDLVKLMENYNQVINHQRFEMRPPDVEFLTNQIARFEELNQKLSTIMKNLEQRHLESTKLSDRIQAISLNTPKIGKELTAEMESTGKDVLTDFLIPLSSTPLLSIVVPSS